MRILGIDPSLTGTGLALIDTNDSLIIDTHTIKTGTAGNDITRRLTRFKYILRALDTYCRKPDLVVIEGPALAQHNAGTWDRAGLWWAIVTHYAFATTIEVPPTTRAKYGTGKGNAGKDAVMLATARRYPHAPIADNNQADAVLLAAIGARLAGHPIEDHLPQANLDALTKLTTPKEATDGTL